jgi:hypothetical protein
MGRAPRQAHASKCVGCGHASSKRVPTGRVVFACSASHRLLPLLLSAVLLAACATTMRHAPASAADASPTAAAVTKESTETGTLHGAPYRIDMSARWNGERELFLHGYEPVGAPQPDPWPRDEKRGQSALLRKSTLTPFL